MNEYLQDSSGDLKDIRIPMHTTKEYPWLTAVRFHGTGTGEGGDRNWRTTYVTEAYFPFLH